MARMRLINDIYNEIKLNDPDTAITLCGLRRLVQTGVIPSVQIGRKRLINYDNLMDYLNNIISDTETVETGTVRKIG